MTCQELHCYLENPLRVEVYMYRESLPVAVSEHLATCGECACLFEEQKALGIGLSMARDAAPQVPAGMDARVLANYRRQMEEPESLGRPRLWSFSNTWLRWAVAAAVIAVVTALLLSRSHAPITAKKIVPPAAVSQQGVEVSAKEPAPVGSSKQEAAVERVRRTSVRTNSSPLPPGFASLMYCDELSCTGQMEVIRVELPTSAGQTSGPAAAPVMAEVLVGDDGIARGIRIVQ